MRCIDRKFFERIILCNSLVWSCEITGQSSLTYQEAVEADRRASSRLADFPLPLRCPLLLLMQLTRQRKITDARDDVFSFVNKQFFVDEEVMATISAQDRYVRLWLILTDFLADRCNATFGYCHNMLSVCLSVCLSRECFVIKQLQLGSCSFTKM